MRYTNASRLRRLVAGALAGSALTMALEVLGAEAAEARPGLDSLRTVVMVWNKIKAEFVSPVTEETLQRNCIRGMLASLLSFP